jgi:hypothetical protein
MTASSAPSVQDLQTEFGERVKFIMLYVREAHPGENYPQVETIEVMERAGPQAVSDLWRAGFPMALAGRVATWFKPLSPDRRGIAAVLTLANAPPLASTPSNYVAIRT